MAAPTPNETLSMPSQLQTRRLLMRWIDTSDAPLLLSIWNDPGFIRYVGDRGIHSEAEAATAIEDAIVKGYETNGYGPYRLTRLGDQTHLGICGLFKRENLAEPDLGYALLPAARGQGYITEAGKAVLAMAQKTLGFNTVHAIVSPDNAASIRTLERLGMCYAGVYQVPGEDQPISRYSSSGD